MNSALAVNFSIEPLIKTKGFPEPKTLNKKAGFEKIKNGNIERNSDVYGSDSWVIDVPFLNKSKSLHIECIENPPGYCETSEIKSPAVIKSGIPYLYRDGKNQYLVIAGKGREDGEEFISVLNDNFKELCKVHVDSYKEGSALSLFLKTPGRFLKWNNGICNFNFKNKS